MYRHEATIDAERSIYGQVFFRPSAWLTGTDLAVWIETEGRLYMTPFSFSYPVAPVVTMVESSGSVISWSLMNNIFCAYGCTRICHLKILKNDEWQIES
jgi:hypothetical protein